MGKNKSDCEDCEDNEGENRESPRQDEKATNEKQNDKTEDIGIEPHKEQKEPHQNESAGKAVKGRKLHCICNQPYDKTRPMLQCGECKKWFHGECVKYECNLC